MSNTFQENRIISCILLARFTSYSAIYSKIERKVLLLFAEPCQSREELLQSTNDSHQVTPVLKRGGKVHIIRVVDGIVATRGQFDKKFPGEPESKSKVISYKKLTCYVALPRRCSVTHIVYLILDAFSVFKILIDST